ncbi:MAG TPA: hypothetical protein VF988_01205, partial [Verrucomicrobiae bacterium]
PWQLAGAIKGGNALISLEIIEVFAAARMPSAPRQSDFINTGFPPGETRSRAFSAASVAFTRRSKPLKRLLPSCPTTPGYSPVLMRLATTLYEIRGSAEPIAKMWQPNQRL